MEEEIVQISLILGPGCCLGEAVKVIKVGTEIRGWQVLDDKDMQVIDSF